MTTCNLICEPLRVFGEIMVTGYIRIAERELCQLRIHHLASAVDSSIAVPEAMGDVPAGTVTGFTEWVGTWRESRVSLGWDWAYIRNEILLLNPSEIRTNIQLIAQDGVAKPPILARMRLAHWLDTMPWRPAAIRELVQNES